MVIKPLVLSLRKILTPYNVGFTPKNRSRHHYDVTGHKIVNISLRYLLNPFSYLSTPSKENSWSTDKMDVPLTCKELSTVVYSSEGNDKQINPSNHHVRADSIIALDDDLFVIRGSHLELHR